MEFSVNLTKLGLDPVTLLGGSTCDRPFQKVLVKTRASTSFTAELKDFVAPFYFAKLNKAELFTEIPIFCGVFGVSNIKVVNPVSSSTYSWNTIGGHFADTSISTSVFVDAPGTYIVTQKIRPDCPFYAIDTIVIPFFANCGILNTHALKFTGKLHHQSVLLSWQRTTDMTVKFYEIERSTDGIRFQQINKIFAGTNNNTTEYLGAKDDVAAIVG